MGTRQVQAGNRSGVGAAMALLAAAAVGAAAPPLPVGIETHLQANDVEVRNGSKLSLTACRLSFDHRLRSGPFDLPAGQVLRVSLEDFHVEPPGPPPSEVQFTHVFLECHEGSRRFATG